MLKEKEDFYMENGFMVFTEKYHKKRGFCCKNKCRHCPWNYSINQKDNASKKQF